MPWAPNPLTTRVGRADARNVVLSLGGLLAAYSLGGLLAACSLGDFELEGRPCPCATGYECDEATQTCTRGSASSASSGGAGPTSSSSGGGAGPSSSSGGGQGGEGGEGPVAANASPLEVAEFATNRTTLRVEESFSVRFEQSHTWQIARLYDGADVDGPSPINLAGVPPYLEGSQNANRLSEPFQFQPQGFGGNPKGWLGSADMTVDSIDRYDETPVRYRVELRLRYLNDYRVTQLSTVHPSGRIDVEARLERLVDPAVTLDWAEAHYTTGPMGATWEHLDSANRVVRFSGPASEARLLGVLRSSPGEWLGVDAPRNAYVNWSPTTISLSTNSSLEARASLALRRLGTGADADQRYADDLLAPAIQVVDGAPMGSGFDDTRGTYVLSAAPGGGPTRFRLAFDRARFAPTIEIRGLSSAQLAAWDLRVDGARVATSDDYSGDGVIGDGVLVRRRLFGDPVLLIHYAGVLDQKSGGHLFSLEPR